MLRRHNGTFKKLHVFHQEMGSFHFYLHYRVTFRILMACYIIVMFYVFAAGPIGCPEISKIPHTKVASYCWYHSTYSVYRTHEETVVKDLPHLGIDTFKDASEYIYHDYYQWICLMLLMQAIFFYLPYGVWKFMEGGKIEQILQNVMSLLPVSSENVFDDAQRPVQEKPNEKLLHAAQFLYRRFGYYNKYAVLYFLCESMAWSNVMFQIYLLDFFLQGEFIPLGQRVLEYFRDGFWNISGMPQDSLSWVFPRVVKCPFEKLVTEGKVERFDVLCTLPVNDLTEMIYVFIWFWYAALLIISSGGMLLTILSLAFPKIRGLRLAGQVSSDNLPLFSQKTILARFVGERSGLGDWFILSLLAERMNGIDFEKFLAYIKYEIIRPRCTVRMKMTTRVVRRNALSWENSEAA